MLFFVRGFLVYGSFCFFWFGIRLVDCFRLCGFGVFVVYLCCLLSYCDYSYVISFSSRGRLRCVCNFRVRFCLVGGCGISVLLGGR